MSVPLSLSMRLKGFAAKLKINAGYLRFRHRIAYSTTIHLQKRGTITIGRNSRIVEMGKIVVHEGGRLIIGDHTTIDRLSEIVITENSELIIGNNVFIGSHINIRVTGKITIGNDCKIAQFVSLINGNYGFKDKNVLIRNQQYQNGSITIQDDVWLGVSVIVMPNVIVEKGAVIGSGTIVLKEVKSYTIVAGNPTRLLGKRE